MKFPQLFSHNYSRIPDHEKLKLQSHHKIEHISQATQSMADPSDW